MAVKEEKHLTPVWIVYVDGRRLDTNHEGALQRIHMDDVLDGVGACRPEFDTSAVRVDEDGTFLPGSDVSVHMGYKDDCAQVFSGEVTDFDLECDEHGHEQLAVTCRTCLHRLQNARRAASFESKRLSDILKGIAETYSLQCEADDFGAAKSYVAEIGVTDYDFFMESAKKYGKTVYAYESKIYVKDEVTVSDDDIILEWGKSLISFSGSESLDGLASECTFTGWDESGCKAIRGSASIGEVPVKIGGAVSWKDGTNGAGGGRSIELVADDLFDNDDAEARAIGRLTESSFSYQTGIAKCEGDHRVHPGMRVSIKYVGEKFSGEYMADRVEHFLSVGGAFITKIHVKRNFCEHSERKATSAIDREMRDNSVKEENFTPELKVDQSKWIAQAGIPDAPVVQEAGDENTNNNDDKVNKKKKNERRILEYTFSRNAYAPVEGIGVNCGSNFKGSITQDNNSLNVWATGAFVAQNLVDDYIFIVSANLIVDGNKVSSSSFKYPDYDFVYDGYPYKVIGDANFKYDFTNAKSIEVEFNLKVGIAVDAKVNRRFISYRSARITVK